MNQINVSAGFVTAILILWNTGFSQYTPPNWINSDQYQSGWPMGAFWGFEKFKKGIMSGGIGCISVVPDTSHFGVYESEDVYLDCKRKMTEDENDVIWAFSTGEKLFVKYEGDYFPLIIRKYFAYINKGSSWRSGRLDNESGVGLIELAGAMPPGMPIYRMNPYNPGSLQKQGEVCSSYIVNFENGDFEEINKAFVKDLLKTAPDIYNEFTKDSEREQKLIRYLKKYFEFQND